MNTELLIQLNGIPGVGPSTIERLRAIGDIHHCSVADLQQQGVSFSQAQAVVTGLADRSFLERELALIAQHRIGILTISDPEYPALLRAIYAPPPVLYYQGAKPTFDKTLAFVGSRAGQQYARTVIGTLVPPLITAGCTIVSGGARGVDFYAHQTALDQAGSTVAVLGSGLLEPYPPTSKPLFTRIIESGSSLVSSFPLKTKPVAGNFPARNRIIAGLSQGCVVVAAADKSGALITARFALEQGREVFAVPGAIDDPLSVGCHRLIQQGAKLVQSVEDIAQEIPWLSGLSTPLTEAKPDANQELIRFCRTPRSLDELVSKTSLTHEELQGLLLQGMLAGTLVQNGAGLYEAL